MASPYRTEKDNINNMFFDCLQLDGLGMFSDLRSSETTFCAGLAGFAAVNHAGRIWL
jgi:hypothetical protein